MNFLAIIETKIEAVKLWNLLKDCSLALLYFKIIIYNFKKYSAKRKKNYELHFDV